MKLEPTRPLANRLLASLDRRDYGILAPSFSDVKLKQGTLLHDVGDEVEHVHFPHAGMISLLAVMNDGKTIETATVGREGVVGAMAGLGLHTAFDRAVVLLPLVASKIGSAAFRKAVNGSHAIRDMIATSGQALLTQVQATAACNGLHDVDKRLCRWILQAQDRNDTDTIRVTQEFLSQMLGVRRSSVGGVARRLQRAGVIRYSRGIVEILDRRALEAAACECYEIVLGRATGSRSVPGLTIAR